jgi:PAS domain S-box-containing protein
MKNRTDQLAIRVAVFYAVFAGLWILLSDRILAALMNSSEITQWQTYKGWVFVAVTAVLLYLERGRSQKAIMKSEQKFRTLAEAAACAIILYHDDGVYYVNPTTERITGYRQDELFGMNLWDICHPDFREFVRSHVLTLQRGERGPGRYEFKIVTKGGEERWLDFTDGVLDDRGKEAALGTAFDITERKRVEEQITHALKEKEVLLKEVHHRVKNNLQVISSLLNLQAKRVKNQEVLDMFIESQNRVKSMALIHERLYRSKDLAHVDFGDYVRNLAESLVHGYAITNVQLRIDIGNIYLGVDAAIPCGLIINELVSNSLKHAFVDGRSGMVSIEILSAGSNKYRLKVGDNGVGIPVKVAFPGVDSLGLQLVVSLTEQLNGTIAVTREGGTVFVIDFETP